jgi:hypothetical protein
MKSKSVKEKNEDTLSVNLWLQIKQKLEETNQTIDWLAEQVPQGKKTFYWHYSRKSIKTDMLWDISKILKHDFFKYCSEYIQKLLAEKRKKAKQVDK